MFTDLALEVVSTRGLSPDFRDIVNSEVDNPHNLAVAMNITPVFTVFSRITAPINVPYMETFLGAVIYGLDQSIISAYEYRFLKAEDDRAIMVIWPSKEELKFSYNGQTSDPINLGQRIVVFEKSFNRNKSTSIHSYILDRAAYRSYLSSLARAVD